MPYRITIKIEEVGEESHRLIENHPKNKLWKIEFCICKENGLYIFSMPISFIFSSLCAEFSG